jgi:hypothetical protein
MRKRQRVQDCQKRPALSTLHLGQTEKGHLDQKTRQATAPTVGATMKKYFVSFVNCSGVYPTFGNMIAEGPEIKTSKDLMELEKHIAAGIGRGARVVVIHFHEIQADLIVRAN